MPGAVACVLAACDSTVELPPPRHDAAVDSHVVVPDTSFDPIDTAEQDVAAIDTAPSDESGVVDAGLDAVHANYAFCIERLPYEDHTSEREVIVNFGGDYGELYLPRCIVIKSGTVVTFVGYFPDHTLLPTDWEPSPVIEITTTGLRRSFTFVVPGFYGYYCKEHSTEPLIGSRMAGSIEVIP